MRLMQIAYTDFLNRAIFYVSRLISSQKERDFENSSYDDIKRVYSIWVYMNMEESSMSHMHLTKEDLIGSYDRKIFDENEKPLSLIT